MKAKRKPTLRDVRRWEPWEGEAYQALVARAIGGCELALRTLGREHIETLLDERTFFVDEGSAKAAEAESKLETFRDRTIRVETGIQSQVRRVEDVIHLLGDAMARMEPSRAKAITALLSETIEQLQSVASSLAFAREDS